MAGNNREQEEAQDGHGRRLRRGDRHPLTTIKDAVVPRAGERLAYLGQAFVVERVDWTIEHPVTYSGAFLRARVVLRAP